MKPVQGTVSSDRDVICRVKTLSYLTKNSQLVGKGNKNKKGQADNSICGQWIAKEHGIVIKEIWVLMERFVLEVESENFGWDTLRFSF